MDAREIASLAQELGLGGLAYELGALALPGCRLAQLELGNALGALEAGLPDSGRLLFFFAKAGSVEVSPGVAAARVVHVPAGTPVARRSWPDELAEVDRLRRCRSIRTRS